MAGLTTPKGVASYPALYAPRLPNKPKPGDVGKYQLNILFDEAATATPEFKALQKAALETAFEKWGDNDKTRDAIKRKAIKLPFITDERVPEGFKAMLRLNGKDAPGVVDCIKDPKTGKARVITDPKEVYPGCFVRATVGAFAYETDGNRGVSFGLRNVQKMGDGPRLDNRSNATDDFDAADPETAPIEESGAATKDDLNDLLG